MTYSYDRTAAISPAMLQALKWHAEKIHKYGDKPPRPDVTARLEREGLIENVVVGTYTSFGKEVEERASVLTPKGRQVLHEKEPG